MWILLNVGFFIVFQKCLSIPTRRQVWKGKFSLEFCIAFALKERNVSLGQFTDSKVKEPGIQQLIKKVKKEVTEEAGGKGTEYPIAILTVHMKNGKSYPCRVEKRKGSPMNPLSAEEVME